jgi:hypothetical protein
LIVTADERTGRLREDLDEDVGLARTRGRA